MAGGSLGRALSLDVEGLARRKEIITASRRSGQISRAVLRFAEEYGARGRTPTGARPASLWTRDVALLKAGATGLANLDMKAAGGETVGRTSRRSFTAAMR